MKAGEVKIVRTKIQEEPDPEPVKVEVEPTRPVYDKDNYDSMIERPIKRELVAMYDDRSFRSPGMSDYQVLIEAQSMTEQVYNTPEGAVQIMFRNNTRSPLKARIIITEA